jgi:hypothetical protein
MVHRVANLLTPGGNAALLDELMQDLRVGRTVWSLLAVMTVGAAFYGAVLGSWCGGLQILYSAVKLPLVLVVTSLLTLVFNWMTGFLLGLRIGIMKAAATNFLVLATAALVLASLTPVAGLVVFSAPQPAVTERTTHNLLYLFHTGLVGVSGLVGTVVLWRALVRLSGRTALAARVFIIWLMTFAVVGGEVAWALRPFVGSIYHPVAFLRADMLDGNVYEFILRDIIPHLLS